MRLVVFSDGWGYKYGGINSFNFAFCNALRNYIAKIIKDRQIPSSDSDIILDIVTCDITDPERSAIQIDKCVNVYNVSKTDLHDLDKILSLLHLTESDDNFESQTFFIGHDIITGEIANNCAKKLNSRSIVFHHMAYEEYYNLITDSENQLSKKTKNQNETLLNADIVIGVGPKLEDSAKTIVTNSGGNSVVAQIIPGFDKADFVTKKASTQFRIFFSGRIEYDTEIKNNNVIKQYDCVVQAFCQMIEKSLLPANSKLYLCGISSKEGKIHFEEIKSKITQKVASIDYRSYIDHDDLLGLLRGSSVAIMPSFDEGFGLTGLEALVSHVPVIISKNSGLYQMLFKENLAQYVKSLEITGSPNIDVPQLEKLILEIKSDQNGCREQVESLRSKLEVKYSWSKVIERFIKFLSSYQYYKISSDDFEESLVSLCFPHLKGE